MIELKPPTDFFFLDRCIYSIFLAGSIEGGLAKPWQRRAAAAFNSYGDDIVILNPRRDEWDTTWKAVKSNKKFRQQVEWELAGLDRADAVIFYFDPATKSPVTLMELGLYGSQSNSYVICPRGYWRKGNVDIVCERFQIPQYSSLTAAIKKIKEDILL